MNAHTRTATDLAFALLGKRRSQDVTVVSRIHAYGHTKRIVLVTPHGAERGELYEVHSLGTLQMLRDGDATAEELELTVYEPEES